MKGVINVKKDRNCGGYPVYPQMVPNFGPVPGQVIPMPAYVSQGQMGQTYSDGQVSSLSNRLNSLEQRVSNLESMINKGTYSNSYNSTNYQMM